MWNLFLAYFYMGETRLGGKQNICFVHILFFYYYFYIYISVGVEMKLLKLMKHQYKI